MKQIGEPERKLIFDHLTSLSRLIDNVYRNENKKKKLSPEKASYYRWKIDKLTHSERGISEIKSSAHVVQKQEWHSATGKIIETIKASQEYADTIEALKPYLHEEIISMFARRIAYLCCEKNFSAR